MAQNEDIVILERENMSSSVKIHLHGATVISWKIKDKELLYVSSKSLFDNKKAIRGGIPFVFPNFGPWKLGPQHGFARISRWEVTQSPRQTTEGDVTVTLSLKQTDSTLAMWKHNFQIDYHITLLKDAIQTNFDIKNSGNNSFDFTCLLHTYIRVDDVRKCSITGLKGLQYVDKVEGGQTFTENEENVVINNNVDRVYINTPSSHIINNSSSGASISVTKFNLPDTVLWNPWIEKAKEMSDFADDEYPLMVCVEAGAVNEQVTLKPGDIFTAGQIIQKCSHDENNG